jgi:AcrR family transcriptional regulator
MKKDVAVRRTEILEATCRVVVERGFGGTRVADVAEQLDVSTGLIHYHFDSKDQLLAEAFSYAAQEDLARLRADIDAATTPVGKLDAAFAMFEPEDGHPSWGLWIDAWGEAMRVKELATISRTLDVEWKDALEQVIRDGVATGEFTCADPRAAAWRLAALMDGLAVQVTVHDGVLTRRELTDWVRAAAIAELQLPPDAFSTATQRR